ncbi:MAG: hypothetical protein L3K52_15695 [Candidatus Thiothrix sulfatifontis]|nr:MAG: hypothetical protein L3K52_15695 [Candidatus Thiothrix sulfatifontis]
MQTISDWRQIARYLWVAPISMWFLPLALLAKWTGGGYALHTGVLEIWGGWVGRWLERGIPFLGAVNAVTVGHIVAGVSPQHLRSSRVHERVHVEQFERWGCLFPCVYFIAGVRAQRRGGSFYWDNPYEIEARRRAAATGKC